MKKKYLFFLSPLLAFVIYVSLTSYSSGIDNVYSAALGGCTCHDPQNTATVITLTGLPASGYQNGIVYSLTLSVTNTSITGSSPFGLRDGFDFKASAGIITPITGTQLGSSNSELLHSVPKAPISGTASWTFNWTAPTTGTATITFNAACNATNGDGSSVGDSWNFLTASLVKNPINPLSLTATSTAILCNGGVSTITATGANGTPPYQYKLNTGSFQSSNSFLGNLAAVYTITVSDALNATASTTINITQPSLIVFAAGTITSPLCNGGTGSISNTATGGTGTTKTYTISPLGPQSNTLGNFTGLSAQTYTLTVSDANSCTKTKLATVTQPSLIAFTPIITNPLCNGGTGSVSAGAIGGTGTKTYTISPLGPQTNTTGNFVGLIAQTYTITATDGNNCSKTTAITITAPPALSIPAPTVVNPLCNGGFGSATINPSGGTGAYTYSWKKSVSLTTIKDNSIFEQNQNNSNGAGEFMYAGKLANGFLNRALLQFDLSSIPSGTSISTANLVMNCSNSAPGSGAQPMNLHKVLQNWGEGESNAGSPGGTGASAQPNDATWINSYHPSTGWTNLGGDFNSTVSGSTLVNAPGFYSWTSSGMMSDLQAWINNPSSNFGWLLKGQESAITQAKRFDTKENLVVANHPMLTITYPVTGTTNSLSNLTAGNYTVTVFDANNCSATVSFTLVEPLPISVSASDVSGCAGSPIALVGSPAGGTFSVPDPYTGPSTTYTYSYTDGDGCTTISSPATITVTACGINVLNLNLFLQGYYLSPLSMLPVLMNQGVIGATATETDSITLDLKDPTTYATIASMKEVLNTDGTVSFNLGSNLGTYYLAISNRNTLPTWSANPVSLVSGTNTYNFTTSANSAYGGNLMEVETGVWALYTGDVVSDENLDLLDLSSVENDIINFTFGYFPTDINGDGNVDLLDTPILEDNVTNFIFSNHP